MPRKKYEDLSLFEIMQKQKRAGISENNRQIATDAHAAEEKGETLPPLAKRVTDVLGIVHDNIIKTNMLFFVMYDIESDKVRNQVAKYLLRMGCVRVQDSVFLANLSHEKYDNIKKSLHEVQSFYENEDSILIVPISTDYLKSMKIIGKSIDIDIIMKNQSTLFF